jgi:CRP-like cAMP-binding protein
MLHPVDHYAEVLSRTEFFSGLTRDELTPILKLMTKVSRAPGDIIHNDGDDCDGLYVIESGTLRYFKRRANGREQEMGIEHEGGVAAMLPVLDDQPAMAACVAVTQSNLLFLSKVNFREICRQNPEIGLKVLRAISVRMRRMILLVEELSFTTVSQRLAALLLRLAQSEGTRTDEGVVFKLPTNQEVGARIGTVREIVSRNLAKFQADGMIRLDGRNAIVTNVPGLQAEAQFGY